MLFLAPIVSTPKVISFGVENDRRSPFRFRVTNLSWEESKPSVSLEIFRGKTRVGLRMERDMFPNVYEAKAFRYRNTTDIFLYANTDGRLVQVTTVWLFSRKTLRLKRLSPDFDNAEPKGLARGRIAEENIARWIDHPPRAKPSGSWFHRTWTYSPKRHRFEPEPWLPGTIKR